MTTFTKEQLIASAHARIEFAEMMLAGELEPLKERTWSIELELARIALASLEAEPVPVTQFRQVADLYEMQFDDGRTCAFHTDAEKAVQWLHTCDGNRVQECVKLERLQAAYAAPPAPAEAVPLVPDNSGFLPCPFCGGQCDRDGWIDGSGRQGPGCEDCGAIADSAEAWNRRVAMQGKADQAPVKQPSSNSPVIPDGWVMVPVEPTAAMYNAGDRQLTTKQTWGAMLAAAPQQEVK